MSAEEALTLELCILMTLIFIAILGMAVAIFAVILSKIWKD